MKKLILPLPVVITGWMFGILILIGYWAAYDTMVKSKIVQYNISCAVVDVVFPKDEAITLKLECDNKSYKSTDKKLIYSYLTNLNKPIIGNLTSAGMVVAPEENK